jgi:hypothetical protein
MLFKNSSKELIRQSYVSAQNNYDSIIESSVDDILEYLSKRTDVSTIRDAMRNRFAVGITKDEFGYQSYSKGMVDAAISQGLYESISSGIATKIINSLANLFSKEDQTWSYVDENGEESEELAELIGLSRAAGAFSTEMVIADRISCGIESCPLLIQINGNSLNYTSFSPANIHILFANTIIENGVPRAPNTLDIEDASCVVIKLSDVDDITSVENQNNYLAIFGRSEDYPMGRYVQYKSLVWNNIPYVGAQGAHDFYIGEEVANPLSWMASNYPDKIIPEYPIIVIAGGNSLTRNKIIEISTSLYDAAVELDVGYSRVLKDALSASTGTKIVSNPDGSPIPKTLEGDVVLNGIQSISMMQQNASNCLTTLQVLGQISKSVAESYSVPGYQILNEVSNESGISLIIKNKPMIDHRQYRIKLNEPQVQKMFKIEQTLIEFATGKDFGAVKQVWNPGSINVPETETEKITRIQTALTAGLISYVHAIKQLHNLSTDEEARNMIDKMRAEDLEYGAPKAAKSGLPGNVFPR